MAKRVNIVNEHSNSDGITVDFDNSTSSSLMSSQPTIGINGRNNNNSNNGGCLKIRTQKESLACKALVISRTSPEKKTTKKVQWGNVEIHAHQIALGDNPATSSSPPLCIGEEQLYSHQLPIDQYEEYRPERRERGELRIPTTERERILMEAGYGRADIREVSILISKIKASRERNASIGPVEKLRYALLVRKDERGKRHQQQLRACIDT
jgi:hypothetical protein